MSPIERKSKAAYLTEVVFNSYLCILILLIIKLSTIKCKSIDQEITNNHHLFSKLDKWIPLPDFRPVIQIPTIQHQASPSLSSPTFSSLIQTNFSPMTSESIKNIKVMNQSITQETNNQQTPTPCSRMFHDQILQVLASQNQNQILESIQKQQEEVSKIYKQPTTENKQPIESVRGSRRARDLNGRDTANHPNEVSSEEDSDDGSYNEEADDEGQAERPALNQAASAQSRGSHPRQQLRPMTGNGGYEPNEQSSPMNEEHDNLYQGLSVQPSGVRDLIDEPPQDQSPPGEESGQNQPPMDEARARKEQEAIESSEAEAENRAALDEQLQAQQEIIKAQSAHEARAIREQQALLLKQQKLQQQMVFMRDRNDLKANYSQAHPYGSLIDRKSLRRASFQSSNGSPSMIMVKSNRPFRTSSSNDIQFSDQSGFNGAVDGRLNDMSPSPQSDSSSSATQPELISEENSPKSMSSLSLLPSETGHHHYGSHFGSLHKHQSHYYQFAESHKKGQFKAGYKRGGKKFKISGHSSQHKNHAEGHVKWKGKKGKGTHYWEFKHKGKPKKHHHHHHY